MQKIGVLFVCHGNICRSPMAEGIFRHLVEEAGWSDRFDIDSAGVSSYHTGESPDPRSITASRKRGIRLEGKARAFGRDDLARFDYVLVMDSENEAGVRSVQANTKGKAEVRRLREFEADANDDLDVPDPYYGGARGFDTLHDMLDGACRALLAHIAEKQGWTLSPRR